MSEPLTQTLPNRSPGDPVYRLVRRPVAEVRPPELDEAQRKVVDHRGGPLLVLAGPGTGKTATIVEVVVDRVLRDGLDPSRILVLTFSRRAAAELRDRIAARLDRTIREPVARTFHSYAFGLLRKEAVLRDLPAPRLLSGPEQDLMIRDLLRGDIEEFDAVDWPARLHAALPTRGFAEELRDLLLRAAERGIRPGELHSYGTKYKRDDWRAASRFAKEYAAVTALRPEAPAYDPAELVREAVSLLDSDEDVLAAERAERSLILVDEFQDADPAQEELLQLIAGDGRELIVVGDPDQSIYAFRGSDVEVIQDFPQRFRTATGEDAPVVSLTTSRRFGRNLLAARRRVANRLGGAGKHRQLTVPSGVADGEVEVHLFRTHNQEAAYVAHRLRQAHLVEGVPWSRMAVLVRAAGQMTVMRRALMTSGVPVAVRLEEVPLVDQPAVTPMLDILQLATGRSTLTPELTVDLLTSCYGGADPLALRRLRQELRAIEIARGGGRGSDELLKFVLARPELLEPLDPNATAPAVRIARLLAAAREAVATDGATAETVLWAIWQATEVNDEWARLAASHRPGAAAADRDLDAVTALFDMVARFVDRLPAAGPPVFLDHLLGQEIPADTLAPQAPEGDAVTLLTAHAAKGLEWDVVAVAGVQDGIWPDLRVRGTLLGSETLVDIEAGRNDSPVMVVNRLLSEERRLFYVAATRAKRRLLVSAISAEEDQPSRFLDEIDPITVDRPYTKVPRGLDLPSVVAELRSVVCDPAVPAVRKKQAAYQLARLASAGVRGADPSSWYALLPLSDDDPLRREDEQVPVSPSKVEAFKACALRWLLESSGGTKGDAISQSIGNLIHLLADEVAHGRITIDQLPDEFERRWGSSVDAGTGWHARKEHERAGQMVARLAKWLRENPRELVNAEKAFGVEVGRAILKGRVDRIERDEHGRLVVLDLKTGKNPPPNAQVEEHVQLGAYQVAVEKGGFGAGEASGGAILVQLGKDRRGGAEQRQPPLADASDPKWAEHLVMDTAEGMAGSEFTATENDLCRMCVAKRSCPLHTDGGQVTP